MSVEVVGFTETPEDVEWQPQRGCCRECEEWLDAEEKFLAEIAMACDGGAL